MWICLDKYWEISNKSPIKPEQTTAEKSKQYTTSVNQINQNSWFILIKSKILMLSQSFQGQNMGKQNRKILEKAGINSAAIHGNKSQVARQRPWRFQKTAIFM